MGEKEIRNFYLKEIFKSFATVLGCLYLATYEDVRKFACIIGFISSVMMASWIKDYIEIKKEIAEALADVNKNSNAEDEEDNFFEDEENEDGNEDDCDEYTDM